MTIKVTGIRITTGVREELNEFAAQAWRDGTTSEAYTDIREDPTDTIGEALRAVQEHFAGEDDPVFADLCDLVNRAAEEHARTPDRTPQLDMGAIVQYQREHADRAWLLAQIRAASAALVAAGIPDDGRPLAERIAGIDKDIAAAVTREMQSRLDACPISRDRIAALQERARALPETSRDARLLIDDLLSEIQFNALNFSDREDDLLSERDDARDGAKRADEERDAALRAAKVLADGGALGPVANDILDAAALLKRIADGERYPIDPTVDLNREP